MNVKYQIFVSSTYEDLRFEREQVVKAILEMGHIPVGMEMFSAADEEQWKLIARTIEEVDYYVAIVAHRYGSTVGGVSYTEKEYDHAASAGVPTLGFTIDPSASWPVDKCDSDPSARDSLKCFKEKIRQKLVSSWTSAEDLHGRVSIALMKQMNTNPRTGWLRASEVVAPAVTAELTRLSSENAALRTQLERARERASEGEHEERERALQILRTNKVGVSFYYAEGTDWEDERKVTLHQIFSLLAPEMLIEKSTVEVAIYLGVMLKQSDKKLRDTYPVPSNSVKSWIADLVMLDLVEPSARKHHLKDTNEYWRLSGKGKDLFAHIRRARLYAGLDSANQTSSAASSAVEPSFSQKSPSKGVAQKKAAPKKGKP